MDHLHDLYRTLDQLNDEELAEVRAYIDQRRAVKPEIADETPQERAAALMAAFAEMREGLSEEQLDAIIADMNSEYIEPLDPDEFAWMDSAEDEEN
ncbi:MAG: hypothetical protein IT319_04760 [Anaerolineae bacterium]|nr:hypothetical protein [Anaerolineae bacterium]